MDGLRGVQVLIVLVVLLGIAGAILQAASD